MGRQLQLWEQVAIAVTMIGLYAWIGLWVLPLWVGACAIMLVCLIAARVVRAIWRVYRE